MPDTAPEPENDQAQLQNLTFNTPSPDIVRELIDAYEELVAAFSPPSMTLYAWIDKDVGLFGVYAIDERVRFNLNADFSLATILTTPPQSWSSAMRQAAQVSEFGNIRPSVSIPFVAFEK